MVSKIIAYQIKNNITDSKICEEIDISRKTFYNIRVHGNCGESTMNKVNDFIKEKGL